MEQLGDVVLELATVAITNYIKADHCDY